MSSNVSVDDWIKGITFSILASIVGSASKLAIRKSWLLEFALAAQDESSLSSSSSSSATTSLLTTSSTTTTTNNNNNNKSSVVTESSETKLAEKSKYHRVVNENALLTTLDAKGAERTPENQQLDSLLRNDHADVCCEAAAVTAHEFDDDEEQETEDEQGETITEEIRRRLGYCCPSWSAVTPATKRQQSRRLLLLRRRRRAWLLPWSLRTSGMVGMTFLNPLCCVLAMKYASPSILAPFSGLTLVWIILLSRVLIGEEPTANQKLAAIMIITGEVMIAIFGDHTNDDGVTMDDVLRSYGQYPILLYFLAMAVWMMCLWYWMAAADTNPFLRRFAWGVSGGSITGLQNFLKDSLTIGKAKHTAAADMDENDDDDVYWPWVLILFITLAVATAFGGLLLLTACMKRYDATYSSAMFVGSFVVSASLMSVVHYRTFQNLTHVWNYFMYPLALAVLMAGVYILVQEAREDSIEDHVDESVDILHTSTTVVNTTDLQEPLLSRQDDEDESMLT